MIVLSPLPMEHINLRQRIIVAVGLVLLATSFVYKPVLDNSINVWDDDAYIVNNPKVKNFSFAGVRDIFTSFDIGNPNT